MIVQAFVKKQECGLENNYFSGGSAILYVVVYSPVCYNHFACMYIYIYI